MMVRGAPGEALRRLVVAVALSAAVHAWLILEVRVSRPAGQFRGESAVLMATLQVGNGQAQVGARTGVSVAQSRPKAEPRERRPRASAAPVSPPPESDKASRDRREHEPRPDPSADDPEAPAVDGESAGDIAAASGGAPTEPMGPAVPMALLEDPEYYPARLLDRLPMPLAEVVLQYPDAAAEAEVSGRVVLLLMIDELGVVVDATVIEADPPGYFEEAAIESFREVLFQPAYRHGRAVKSRLPVEVTFDARTDSAKP